MANDIISLKTRLEFQNHLSNWSSLAEGGQATPKVTCPSEPGPVWAFAWIKKMECKIMRRHTGHTVAEISGKLH